LASFSRGVRTLVVFTIRCEPLGHFEDHAYDGFFGELGITADLGKVGQPCFL
jgi:hypothetical protein